MIRCDLLIIIRIIWYFNMLHNTLCIWWIYLVSHSWSSTTRRSFSNSCHSIITLDDATCYATVDLNGERVTQPLAAHELSHRVLIPNSVGKILSLLVWFSARLFHIRSKVFLYLHNPWIFLFLMVYKWSSYSIIFPEKSAVYDGDLHLL
jgi:hypothetical protein